MKVDVQKQNDSKTATIAVEMPAEFAQQEYGKACRRLGQRVNVPGFRRGKVPRGLVEKTVGVERIKQEALDRLLPHVFSDVISEHQLDIVAPPQVESCDFDLDSGVTIKAQVELRPEVTLPDLSGIKVEVEETGTPQDAIENELQQFVEQMTTLEPVIDRPAEAEDIVNIDFAGSINGEQIRGGSAKNYRLDLANSNFIEGFADQIVGHKIGEEFTINVSFHEDYHDNSLSGKPAQFLVKINEIKRKVTPEMNDELAKRVPGVNSLEDLRNKLEERLQEKVDQENQSRAQKAVVDWVVERAEVEIPDSMIQREARVLYEDLQQRFKSMGASFQQYVEQQGEDKLWEQLRDDATHRVKTSLVFGALSKQQEFKVEPDEFNSYVQAMARGRQTDERGVMRYLANHPEAIQAVNDQILAGKVVEWLIEKADVTRKPASNQAKKSDSSPAATEPENKPDATEAAAASGLVEGEEYETISEQ